MNLEPGERFRASFCGLTVLVLAAGATVAGTSAVHTAAAADRRVQNVDYTVLQSRLVKDGQVLNWTPPRVIPRALDSRELDGQAVDDQQARMSGNWSLSGSVQPFFDRGYLHDGNANKGKLQLLYEFRVEQTGRYELRMNYTAHANRATNVPVVIEFGERTQSKTVNQRKQPELAGGFVSLGRFELEARQSVRVTIGNTGTDGYVVADVVQLVPVKE